MLVRVNMYAAEAIEIDGCVIKSRAAAERLARWLLEQANELWPEKSKEPPGGK